MDIATLLGTLIAFVGIVGGLLWDGGNIQQVLHPAAAFIVLGGTLGAVLVSFPLRAVRDAGRAIFQLLTDRAPSTDDTLNEIVAFARRAKREGFLSFERHLHRSPISDALLRQGLTLVADGHDERTVRSVLELKVRGLEERLSSAPLVLESAAGYAPTIGILGAVLGLIQVLNRLDGIENVGTGIAVAFVATFYGVGLANLFFLPLATKLRVRQREELIRKDMIVEGIVSIREGVNPHLLENKLRSFRGREDVEAA